MALNGVFKNMPAHSREEAKKYLAANNVAQLFESLTVGLLHNKPDDPLNFVQDCLHSVQGQKPSEIRWNSFQDKVQTKSDETSPKTDI